MTLKKKPTEYLQQVYVDTMVFTPRALNYLAQVMSTSHIMLGTDYPYPWMEAGVGTLGPVDHLPARDSAKPTRWPSSAAMPASGWAFPWPPSTKQKPRRAPCALRAAEEERLCTNWKARFLKPGLIFIAEAAIHALRSTAYDFASA